MLINGEKLNITDKDKDKDKDKDSSLKNIFVFDKRISKAKLCSDKEAESGAARYARILNAPESLKFFIKVMYHLPYNVREGLLEASTKPKVDTPKRYFLYCAKRELERRGF